MKWLDNSIAILSDGTFCWFNDNEMFISGNNWKQRKGNDGYYIPIKYKFNYSEFKVILKNFENIINEKNNRR